MSIIRFNGNAIDSVKLMGRYKTLPLIEISKADCHPEEVIGNVVQSPLEVERITIVVKFEGRYVPLIGHSRIQAGKPVRAALASSVVLKNCRAKQAA